MFEIKFGLLQNVLFMDHFISVSSKKTPKQQYNFKVLYIIAQRPIVYF